MAGNVVPQDYLNAKADPLAPFAHFIINHMNEDHADATAAIVQHYAGVGCREASIVSIDRYGMTVRNEASPLWLLYEVFDNIH